VGEVGAPGEYSMFRLSPDGRRPQVHGAARIARARKYAKHRATFAESLDCAVAMLQHRRVVACVAIVETHARSVLRRRKRR
jgi:hypothetical protein